MKSCIYNRGHSLWQPRACSLALGWVLSLRSSHWSGCISHLLLGNKLSQRSCSDSTHPLPRRVCGSGIQAQLSWVLYLGSLTGCRQACSAVQGLDQGGPLSELMGGCAWDPVSWAHGQRPPRGPRLAASPWSVTVRAGFLRGSWVGGAARGARRGHQQEGRLRLPDLPAGGCPPHRVCHILCVRRIARL